MHEGPVPVRTVLGRANVQNKQKLLWSHNVRKVFKATGRVEQERDRALHGEDSEV